MGGYGILGLIGEVQLVILLQMYFMLSHVSLFGVAS